MINIEEVLVVDYIEIFAKIKAITLGDICNDNCNYSREEFQDQGSTYHTFQFLCIHPCTFLCIALLLYTSTIHNSPLLLLPFSCFLYIYIYNRYKIEQKQTFTFYANKILSKVCHSIFVDKFSMQIIKLYLKKKWWKRPWKWRGQMRKRSSFFFWKFLFGFDMIGEWRWLMIYHFGITLEFIGKDRI